MEYQAPPGSMLCHNPPYCAVTYLTPSILHVDAASTPPAGGKVNMVLWCQTLILKHRQTDTAAVIDGGCLEDANAFLCSYWRTHDVQATF